MAKSIFELSDKFNYNSPWENDWGNDDFQYEISRHQHNYKTNSKNVNKSTNNNSVISNYDEILKLESEFELALALSDNKPSKVSGWENFKQGRRYYNCFKWYNYIENEMPQPPSKIILGHHSKFSPQMKILPLIGEYVFYNTKTGNKLYNSVELSLNTKTKFYPSMEDIRDMLMEAGKVIYRKNTELGGLKVGNFDFYFDGYKCFVIAKIKIEIDKDVSGIDESNVSEMLFNALSTYWTESGFYIELKCKKVPKNIPIYIYAQKSSQSYHKILHVQNNVWFSGNRPIVIDEINITTDSKYYDIQTFAHEFGHVLGLYDEYKSSNVAEQNMWWKDNKYNYDKSALMNIGHELRDRYFEHYKKTVKKLFPNCELTVKQ